MKGLSLVAVIYIAFMTYHILQDDKAWQEIFPAKSDFSGTFSKPDKGDVFTR